jgi:hypothetical protein
LAPFPRKNLAGSPAQMICSAQEEPPQRKKFNEDESCKYYILKVEKINEKDCRDGHKIV